MSSGHFDLAFRLLWEEYKYDELPRKAIHKILYLVDKQAAEEGLDVDIPYFWFQFGVVTPAEREPQWPADSVSSTTDEGTVESTRVEELEESLRPIVKSVLQRYYATSLEELTDVTYRDAPYEVQHSWRTLDKKIRTLHPEFSDFYDENPVRESIQESLYDVFDAFPVSSFPELESDLTKWYSMMTRELNRDGFDPERLMSRNILFWRIVALRIAERHRNQMTKSDIEAVLEIESMADEAESCRVQLHKLESKTFDDQFGDEEDFDTVETRAADAVADAVVSNVFQLS